ncbi:hypothetical protein ACKU27_13605 [Sphingobium yanoikuyae]|uniref:hypothetical protein n=1 Tax=Sphingobium yanoikuyae TaxID=13690 RepID=UPI003B8EF01E
MNWGYFSGGFIGSLALIAAGATYVHTGLPVGLKTSDQPPVAKVDQRTEKFRDGESWNEVKALPAAFRGDFTPSQCSLGFSRYSANSQQMYIGGVAQEKPFKFSRILVSGKRVVIERGEDATSIFQKTDTGIQMLAHWIPGAELPNWDKVQHLDQCASEGADQASAAHNADFDCLAATYYIPVAAPVAPFVAPDKVDFINAMVPNVQPMLNFYGFRLQRSDPRRSWLKEAQNSASDWIDRSQDPAGLSEGLTRSAKCFVDARNQGAPGLSI